MTDSGDMDALAQRYIDLWQEQVAQISADPKIVGAWNSALQSAAQDLGWTADAIDAYTAVRKGAVAGAGATGGPAGDAPGDSARDATRAQASTAASDGGGDDPAALLRRINALERKLAALETD